MFTKRAAVEAFYYLMAADGEVTDDELTCFNGIGLELDPDNFYAYRDDAISLCELQMDNLIDEDDYYDVVAEGLDISLNAVRESEEQMISPSLLVWDMLVIAFSNSSYSDYERRLIKHVVRICHIEKTVFLEMEQLIQTNLAIDNELNWLKSSDRPYSEVRPIVDELESRRLIILESANALIEDAQYTTLSKLTIPQNKFLADTKEKIEGAITPVASEISERTGRFVESAKAKLNKAGADYAINQKKLPRMKLSGFTHKKEEPKADNSVS